MLVRWVVMEWLVVRKCAGGVNVGGFIGIRIAEISFFLVCFSHFVVEEWVVRKVW